MPMDRTHANCPECNYSASPERVYTERKHFSAHALRCTRCGYTTETKRDWGAADRFWNTARASRTVLRFPDHAVGQTLKVEEK
jgi:ssDNA-binding Zn-finger/Zn-ribbon topoisomerase 1